MLDAVLLHDLAQAACRRGEAELAAQLWTAAAKAATSDSARSALLELARTAHTIYTPDLPASDI